MNKKQFVKYIGYIKNKEPLEHFQFKVSAAYYDEDLEREVVETRKRNVWLSKN